MSNPVIEAKNIVVRFGIRKGLRVLHFNAVDNASLSVDRGEIVALVGESGSGKTTLGKVTLGLIKPTAGEVLYKGRNIFEMNKNEYMDYRRNAQYVPQDPYASLHPLKTVRQTLADVISAHKLTTDEEEIDKLINDILVSVGLNPPEKYINKYPIQLSGGERQRLSIARALILKPQYVVADEPVTMLDASLKAGIVRTLRSLIENINASLLFITHELSLIQFFGKNTKINVMYLGEIVERGYAYKVLTEPKHPYTQALLAAIPVPDPKERKSRKNILKGEIPSPLNKPPGCPLNPRCPYAMDKCLKEKPPLEEVEPNHFVACWLYSKH